MRIRRVDIENFRGVRALSWRLPAEQTFFVLIGPGDATKSTILTAVQYALSDRWNITFTDTDFHNANIEVPIQIRVAICDLPNDLLGLDELGQHVAGINDAGDWTRDCEDGTEKCIIVELRIEADLEPQWTIYRPADADDVTEDDADGQNGADADDEEQHPLKARHRARFGAFRVDERVDTHLRWSRMSALGKLTANKNGPKLTLTAASRAAREAAAAAVTSELQLVADEVGAAVRAIGSAGFDDLKPGLDLSLGSAQGNLALFDGSVPLMNFGLGTRRLAGAATQQLAHEDSTILLVDEVEYGLEPHRLVHLLRHLKKPDKFAQVFVTTHSPTALRHLQPSDLVMVRSDGASTAVRSLGEPDTLKSVIRATPEAFLARRVVLGEGKTEYGLLLALINAWDDEHEAQNELPAAALGVVAAEGDGGTGTLKRAIELRSVDYDVIVMIDSDDEAANAKVPDLIAAGGKVVQWSGGVSTEQAICSQLELDGLTAFVAAAVAGADDPDGAQTSIASQVQSGGAPQTHTPLQVGSWLSEGKTLNDARAIVGEVAKKSGWFKNVDRGKHLGALILTRQELQNGDVAATVALLRNYIYEKPSGLVADGGNPGEAGSSTPPDSDSGDGTGGPIADEADGPPDGVTAGA